MGFAEHIHVYLCSFSLLGSIVKTILFDGKNVWGMQQGRAKPSQDFGGTDKNLKKPELKKEVRRFSDGVVTMEIDVDVNMTQWRSGVALERCACMQRSMERCTRGGEQARTHSVERVVERRHL